MQWPTEARFLQGGVIAVGLGYFFATKLRDTIAFPAVPGWAQWTPNAILFAALLLAPTRQWPWYLLAVLPVHLVAQELASMPAQVAIQYFADCLEAVLGASALLWLEPRVRNFHKLGTMVKLILLGGVAVPFLISAAMAAAFVTLKLTDDFWLTTVTRTATNAFTTMTLVPLIVHGADWLTHARIDWRRMAEAAVIAACLLAIGAMVFTRADPPHGHVAPALLYAPIPVLLWATVRLGIAGTCGSILLVCVLASWGVSNGTGPFSDRLPVENALSLALFLDVTCTTLLLLAAVVQERKETAAALVRSEQLHRAVLASLQQQIAVLDQAGNIIEVNESWRRARGHKQCEHCVALPGQNYVTASALAARRGEPACGATYGGLQAVLSGVSSRRDLEFPAQHRGELRWFEQSIEALQRPERGAVITLSDITTRKRAELEVLEQQRQIAHLARVATLGEFSGAIAHEIGQPLAAILANAEAGVLLYEIDGDGSNHIKEILYDIVTDCTRAAQVLERLRIMLRNAESLRQPHDLNELVQESLMLARVDLARHGVVAMRDLDPSLPSVACDRVQIEQVILNLIVNACQAMANVPADAKRLELVTRWAVKPVEVELVVCDRGGGIDQALLERIFEPFVTTKADGLGLGLSISRSIVVAHGGRLWAENTQAGAAFHLTLPVKS